MDEEIHADTTPETWDFMQQHGLNDAHIDSGMLTPTIQIIQRTYFSVPTPVRQALEIWALIWNLKVGMVPTLLPASAQGMAYISGRILYTYTQPQPPATNNTTDAATAGNLQFRNGFFDKQFFVFAGMAQAATQTAEVAPLSSLSQGQIFLKKPRRIACSQLETQVITGNLENLSASRIHLVADILYRFVTVSEQEYNALVALSSGQAVLSEVIVA